MVLLAIGNGCLLCAHTEVGPSNCGIILGILDLTMDSSMLWEESPPLEEGTCILGYEYGLYPHL